MSGLWKMNESECRLHAKNRPQVYGYYRSSMLFINKIVSVQKE